MYLYLTHSKDALLRSDFFLSFSRSPVKSNYTEYEMELTLDIISTCETYIYVHTVYVCVLYIQYDYIQPQGKRMCAFIDKNIDGLYILH